MEQATKPAKATQSFFDMDNIPVRLTYGFTDPATVITFYCKLALADDDRDARQKFYAQPDAEQAAGLHAYYVDLLARITVRQPEGLPGFDFPAGTEVAAAIREFFADAGNAMKRKIVADAVEQYNRITVPAEFFR
jgi:hypothetical protein